MCYTHTLKHRICLLTSNSPVTANLDEARKFYSSNEENLAKTWQSLDSLISRGKFEDRNKVRFKLFDSTKYCIVGNHIKPVREPKKFPDDHSLKNYRPLMAVNRQLARLRKCISRPQGTVSRYIRCSQEPAWRHCGNAPSRQAMMGADTWPSLFW